MDLLGNGGFESPVVNLGAPLLNNPRGFAGDLEIEGYLASDTIKSRTTGTVVIDDNLQVEKDMLVKGGKQVNGDMTVKGKLNIGTSITTGDIAGVVGGNIECLPPGIFVGDGSGLYNLPLPNLSTPDFSFQPTILNTGVFLVNPFWFTTTAVPAVDSVYLPIPMPYVKIECAMAGKDPGVYFWKTDAAIAVQQLWNSASGYVYWDGTKVSGQTTYSDYFDTTTANISGAFYNTAFRSYTRSYLKTLDLTTFIVEIASTNTSVNPAQYQDYYVNFYKVGEVTSVPPLPVPTGLTNTALTSTSATLTWDSAGAGLSYTLYLTPVIPGPTIPFPVGADITTATVTGLTPNTSYNAVICSKFGSRSSAPSSPPVSVTTPP